MPAVTAAFRVETYVDNGRETERPVVARARAAAEATRANVRVAGPGHRIVPLEPSATTTVTAVVPAAWPESCTNDPNDCSVGLRVDYCASSVLITGDASATKEALLPIGGPVTLLVVGHHGSASSTSSSFLSVAAPKYAVVSAGRPREGLNRHYCHPRASTVERLTAILGAPGGPPVVAFDGDHACGAAADEHWRSVTGSTSLWLTARDGDVILTTAGDGIFKRR